MIDFHQYPYIWVFGLLYRFITSFVPVFVLYIFSVNSSLNGSVIINLSLFKLRITELFINLRFYDLWTW